MPQSNGRVEGSLKEILPMGRRILVMPHETQEYKGKIIIPDNCKQMAPTSGVVRALGFDLKVEEAYPLSEGDTIVYSKYAGVEFGFDDGHRLLIIHEDDVLGIMHGEARISPDFSRVAPEGR